jgi:hypothetical protein
MLRHQDRHRHKLPCWPVLYTVGSVFIGSVCFAENFFFFFKVISYGNGRMMIVVKIVIK